MAITRLNKNNFLRWDGEFSITEKVSIIFASILNANINALYSSNPLVISGLISAKPISISPGFEYQINGGAWNSAPLTINSGDSVVLRSNSSGSYVTSVIGTLTIGSDTGTFTITTKVAPPVLITASIYQVGDPYTDVDLLLSVNGIFNFGLYSTEPPTNLPAVAGDYVSLVAHSPDGVWPVGAKRITNVYEDGLPLLDVTEIVQGTLTYFQFQALEGKTYTIGTRTVLGGNKRFQVQQFNRRIEIVPLDGIIGCPLTVNVTFYIHEDATGNDLPPQTIDVSIAANASQGLNVGGNITAGPADLIYILNVNSQSINNCGPDNVVIIIPLLP